MQIIERGRTWCACRLYILFYDQHDHRPKVIVTFDSGIDDDDDDDDDDVENGLSNEATGNRPTPGNWIRSEDRIIGLCMGA